MEQRITSPLSRNQTAALSCGDRVYLSGVIYTARDAAHKRMDELLSAGEELPFSINNAVIYYSGPTPEKPGRIIGSAGPTTSSRMDIYTPRLLSLGLGGMIGKGRRSDMVSKAIMQNGAVYFGAIGGAGALLSECIKSVEIIAFEDLGTEAIRKLRVEDFPLTVIIDSLGNDLYNTGRAEYLRSLK